MEEADKKKAELEAFRKYIESTLKGRCISIVQSEFAKEENLLVKRISSAKGNHFDELESIFMARLNLLRSMRLKITGLMRKL